MVRTASNNSSPSYYKDSIEPSSPTFRRNTINRFISQTHDQRIRTPSNPSSNFLRVLIPSKPSSWQHANKHKLGNIHPTNPFQASSFSNHSKGDPSSTPQARISLRTTPIEQLNNQTPDSNHYLDEKTFDHLPSHLHQIQIDNEIFQKFDSVFVVPEGKTIPEDFQVDKYWIAIIKEIKQTDKTCENHSNKLYHHHHQHSAEIFLKVEWFYRFDDFFSLRSSHPSFFWISNELEKFGFRSRDERYRSKDFHFQDKELIKTDHASIIHVQSLAGKAEVYRFEDHAHPHRSISKTGSSSEDHLDHNSISNHNAFTSISSTPFYYRIQWSFQDPRFIKPFNAKFNSQTRKKMKPTPKSWDSIKLLRAEYECGCSRIYEPDKDLMIYNFKAKSWLHLECLPDYIRRRKHGLEANEERAKGNPVKKKPLDHDQGDFLNHPLEFTLRDIKQKLWKLILHQDPQGNHLDSKYLDQFFHNPSRSCFLRGLHSSLLGTLI